MHELTLCRSLLGQVEHEVARRGGGAVARIWLEVGPLSGVVPALLERAFEAARHGTVAANAELIIEQPAVRVLCTACGADTEATVSSLSCRACGDRRTQLIADDELTLQSFELRPHGESNHVH